MMTFLPLKNSLLYRGQMLTSSHAATIIKTKNLLCAQKLGIRFQKELGLTDEDIDSYTKLSRGKAPGGLCGALYVAQQVIKNPENQEKAAQEFCAQAGGKTCKQIRSLDKFSCAECVGLGIKLAEKYMD